MTRPIKLCLFTLIAGGALGPRTTLLAQQSNEAFEPRQTASSRPAWSGFYVGAEGGLGEARIDSAFELKRADGDDLYGLGDGLAVPLS